jgi:hypothetical protein
VNLGTSFTSSCRVLGSFGTIWRHSEVASCPTFNRVTASECQYVGTYVKKTTSGSISGSGSGSKTDWTTTVKLTRDHFFTYDDGSFGSTCYSGSCKYTSNSKMTEVGTWSVAAGARGIPLSTLKSAQWTFTPSTVACPGP